MRFNDLLKRAINWTLHNIAKAPVRISLFLVLSSIFGGGALYSLFEENADYIDGMYWATVVLPTVGFGDFSPEHIGGRLVYMYVVASGWFATIFVGAAVVDAIRERTIEQKHEQTPEFDDDLVHLKQQAQEVVDCIERFSALVDNDHIRAAARKAAEERNGTLNA